MRPPARCGLPSLSLLEKIRVKSSVEENLNGVVNSTLLFVPTSTRIASSPFKIRLAMMERLNFLVSKPK